MAQGHMIPMTDIARLFSLRGVKSTIITTPLLATNISSQIARYKNSGLNINIQTVTFPCKEGGLPEGLESMHSITSPDMASKFFDATTMLQPQFEQLLADMQPDCIVSDFLLPWTNDAALKNDIPRLVFHGTSFLSQCLSESLKHYYPHESDSEIFVVTGLPDEIKFKKSQMPKTSDVTFNSLFMDLINRASESEVKSYGVLVNSFYELEPSYADHYRQVMGRKAWQIGPVSQSNSSIIDKVERGKKTVIDEHYCLNWLNMKKHNSVIYISFGSLSHFSCSQLTEISQGLEASGLPFIWVMRTWSINKEEKFLPDGFERRLEGKGLVIRDWAPQVLILDHPAIGGFMTHCGWNSTLESVSAGVPMITWPLFAEQFQNEALITQVLKIVIKVGVEHFSFWVESINSSVDKERVEKLVNLLMRSEEGEEMRKRARELKEMAKKAVEEGGSSHAELAALIEELHQQ